MSQIEILKINVEKKNSGKKLRKKFGKKKIKGNGADFRPLNM